MRSEGRDGLRLRVMDEKDVQSLSSLSQDALIPLRDIAWIRSEKRFVFVANRFCWEHLPEDFRGRSQRTPTQVEEQESDASFSDSETLPTFYRVNSGYCFDAVQSVQSRGIDLEDREQIICLLALSVERSLRGHHIFLHFAGGGVIRLKVRSIRCHLDDVAAPWSTLSQPRHALSEESTQRPLF